MKADEYRAAVIALIKSFIRKWQPVFMSVNFPMRYIIQEHRENYRKKTCETCRWKSNVTYGTFTTGDKQYYCRGLGYEFRTSETTPACPRYES